MKDQYILAIDQGTSGSTAAILKWTQNQRLEVVHVHNEPFPQHFPQDGWVEHDLNELWKSVEDACLKCFKQIQTQNPAFDHHNIAAIGITNQRETICFWDKKTKQPLRKAIVWQCKRSTEICERLKNKGLEAEISAKTGLLLDPYFSASKILWVKEQQNEIFQEVVSGRAAVGTVDSFLIHRLTDGVSYVTEASNASRTMLYNIHESRWDETLVELFGLPSEDVLPIVKDSCDNFGVTKGLGFLPDGIPITGVLGDQQAALAGQGCVHKGDIKCTYGTGAFILMQTKETPLKSEHKLLTTVAWQIKGVTSYALEGGCFIAGAAVQFIRDNFKFITDAAQSELDIEDAVAAPILYLVPAFAGLGAPYWSSRARAALMGMDRGTTAAQVKKATLEGIAFQVYDLISAMSKDLGSPIHKLKVDGGASRNNYLMQFQADINKMEVDLPKVWETTVYGVGLFAALGLGLFADITDIPSLVQSDMSYKQMTEKLTPEKRKNVLDGWKRAVKAVQYFADYSSS